MADFAAFTARVDMPTGSRAASGESAIVHISGEVDIVAAPQLQHQLETLVAEGHTELVLDLSGVEFIDAAGIGVLVSAYNRTARAGGHLTLRRPSPAVQGLLAVAKLDGTLPTEE
jgi:anti-sigma B factor antagonist